jgi:hypothetical protein
LIEEMLRGIYYGVEKTTTDAAIEGGDSTQ